MDAINSNTPESASFDVTFRSQEQSLTLTLSPEVNMRQALDRTGLRVRAACGGLGTCGACLIQIVSGEFNPPTLAERQKILPDDLAKGMRLACQLRANSDAELYLENPAPNRIGKAWMLTGFTRRFPGIPPLTGMSMAWRLIWVPLTSLVIMESAERPPHRQPFQHQSASRAWCGHSD